MADMAHDLVIRGGHVADGRGGEPVAGDVAVDGGTITAVGTVGRAGARGDRRRRPAGHAGLRRHPHPLRRPGHVGLVPGPLELARRDHGGDGQLRRRLRAGAAGRARAAHLADGGRRGHPRRGAATRASSGRGRASANTSTRSSAGRTTSTCARSSPTARCASTSWGNGPPAWRMRRRTTRRPCAQLAAEAMRDGAVGFSTSRTLNHRTASGDPTPSLRARVDELEAIAAGRGRRRARGDRADLGLLPRHRRRVRARALDGRRVGAAAVAVAGAEPPPARGVAGACWAGSRSRWPRGCRSAAQVAPRPVGVLVGLQSSYHPFLMFPAWRDVAGLPVAEQAQALRDPAFRDRLLAEVPEDDGGAGGARAAPAHRLRQPVPAGRGARLRAAAGGERGAHGGGPGRRPGGADARPAGRERRAELPLHALLQLRRRQPRRLRRDARRTPTRCSAWATAGRTSGLIADASFPTYFLSHWARDRGARPHAGGPGGRAADDEQRPGGGAAPTAAWWPRG